MPAHGPQYAGEVARLSRQRNAGGRLAAIVRPGPGSPPAKPAELIDRNFFRLKALNCWDVGFHTPGRTYMITSSSRCWIVLAAAGLFVLTSGVNSVGAYPRVNAGTKGASPYAAQISALRAAGTILEQPDNDYQ